MVSTIRVSRAPSFAAGVALLALLALAIRLAYIELLGDRLSEGADSLWYQLQAGTIAGGDGYVDPAAAYGEGRSVATANFPPLWPAVLAVVHRLGGQSEQWFQAAGAVVGTATVVLTAVLGRRLAGPTVGLVAGLLAAVSPALVAADGSVMSDSLFTLLVTSAVLLAYVARDRTGFLPWAALGITLGLATLTRSDGLLLAPAVVLAAAVRRPSTGRRWALAGVSLGAVLLTLMPWAVRNTVRLDEPVLLSSNSGSLLEGANCPSTYEGPLLGLWDPACLRFTRAPGLVETEWAAEGREAGLDHARSNGQKLPLVAGVRVLRGLGLYDPIDQARAEAVETRDPDWQVLALAHWLLVLPAAAVGAVIAHRRRVALGPLVGLFAGVVVVIALSWGNQRFRLAAEPSAYALAAVALTSLLRRGR